jgi:hypothetical protein
VLATRQNPPSDRPPASYSSSPLIFISRILTPRYPLMPTHPFFRFAIVTSLLLCSVPSCFRDPLKITSTPPGATVELDGIAVCSTPYEPRGELSGVGNLPPANRGFIPNSFVSCVPRNAVGTRCPGSGFQQTPASPEFWSREDLFPSADRRSSFVR